MGWAAPHIDALLAGRSVKFRPVGKSMAGRIESGQLVTVVPLNSRVPKEGDVVLCRVRDAEYLHLVLAINGDCFKIGNNKGRVNGWTREVFGVCTRVEP